MAADYTEDDIKSLDWREHIRMRPTGIYVNGRHNRGVGFAADLSANQRHRHHPLVGFLPPHGGADLHPRLVIQRLWT